jgi:hypothetical protein
MAIAPLPQQEQFELLEIPWPKPSLRLVPMSTPVVERGVIDDEPSTVGAGITSIYRPAPRVRALNGSIVRRRRRLVLGAVVVALVLLSFPLQALGGKTVTGQSAPSGVTAGLPDGSLYIVQPGDTLASIAHRINPGGDQAALIRALRTTVGSPVVVPGEHIVLP